VHVLATPIHDRLQLLGRDASAAGPYGERGKAVTSRAQVHRVRMCLGSLSLEPHPYRLSVPVEADWLAVSCGAAA
jgi:hypothetical protein